MLQYECHSPSLPVELKPLISNSNITRGADDLHQDLTSDFMGDDPENESFDGRKPP
jgi:hypothetical protein